MRPPVLHTTAAAPTNASPRAVEAFTIAARYSRQGATGSSARVGSRDREQPVDHAVGHLVRLAVGRDRRQEVLAVDAKARAGVHPARCVSRQDVAVAVRLAKVG